jgi:TonB family protein
MHRAVYVLGLFVVLAALCGGRTLAVTEACPAQAGEFHPIGAKDVATTFAFELFAQSARTVAGTLMVGTSSGWYEVGVPAIALTERKHTYDGKFGPQSRVSYESPPIYVRFPQRVEVIIAFVSQAQTHGETAFGWDAKGDASCTPQAGVDTNEPPQFGVDGFHETAPRVDLDAAPTASSIIASFAKAPAPGSTDCAAPFADADVMTPVAPDYPDSEQRRSPVLVVVQVVVNAAASPIDAWIYLSSGSAAFDAAALSAAEASHYHAGTMFCRPIGGFLLYPVEFDP